MQSTVSDNHTIADSAPHLHIDTTDASPTRSPYEQLWCAVLAAYWLDASAYHRKTQGGTRPDLQPNTANAAAEREAWADLMSDAAPLLAHICAHTDHHPKDTRRQFINKLRGGGEHIARDGGSAAPRGS